MVENAPMSSNNGGILGNTSTVFEDRMLNSTMFSAVSKATELSHQECEPDAPKGLALVSWPLQTPLPMF